MNTKVHFSLRDALAGTTARDTRADMEPIQFVLRARKGMDGTCDGRTSGAEIAAMDACAFGMVEGERATFDVPAELAYGERGNFSFPSVGKNRALVLDIDILGVMGSAEEPEELQRDMTYETRVARVKGHRARGNEMFTSGDAEGAIREYSMALTYLTEDFMMQLFDKYEIEAQHEFAAAHGNLCAAYLRLNAFEDVITHAGYVLRVDDQNAKAYYRRGKARASLGQDAAAREDFLKAKKITEDAGTMDANVVKALRDLDMETRERDKASSKVFKGMFGTENAAENAAGDARADAVEREVSTGGYLAGLRRWWSGSRRK